MAGPYAIIASRAATVSYISMTCPLVMESFGNELAKSYDRQQKDSKNDSKWTTETVALFLTTSFECEKSSTTEVFDQSFLYRSFSFQVSRCTGSDGITFLLQTLGF